MLGEAPRPAAALCQREGSQVGASRGVDSCRGRGIGVGSEELTAGCSSSRLQPVRRRIGRYGVALRSRVIDLSGGVWHDFPDQGVADVPESEIKTDFTESTAPAGSPGRSHSTPDHPRSPLRSRLRDRRDDGRSVHADRREVGAAPWSEDVPRHRHRRVLRPHCDDHDEGCGEEAIRLAPGHSVGTGILPGAANGATAWSGDRPRLGGPAKPGAFLACSICQCIFLGKGGSRP